MESPDVQTVDDIISNCHPGLAHTPIVLSELLNKLGNYPLIEEAKILADGFQQGFRLGCSGRVLPRIAPNLPSVAANKPRVKEIILEEVAAGRVAGPFKDPPIQGLVCSPIGLVPKSTPGKYRLIHNLSWPRGESVNDFIDSIEEARVSYSSFDSVIHKIVGMGKGTLLAKVEIRSAFRLLPVHPDDYRLLGFRF